MNNFDELLDLANSMNQLIDNIANENQILENQLFKSREEKWNHIIDFCNDVSIVLDKAQAFKYGYITIYPGIYGIDRLYPRHVAIQFLGKEDFIFGELYEGNRTIGPEVHSVHYFPQNYWQNEFIKLWDEKNEKRIKRNVAKAIMETIKSRANKEIQKQEDLINNLN